MCLAVFASIQIANVMLCLAKPPSLQCSLRLAARRAAVAAHASAEVEITVEEDAVRGSCTLTLVLDARCKLDVRLGLPRRAAAAAPPEPHPSAAVPTPDPSSFPDNKPCPIQQMEKMEKSVEATKRSFNTVRTGRANPAMLDRIEVRAGPPTCSQAGLRPAMHRDGAATCRERARAGRHRTAAPLQRRARGAHP